MTTPLSSCKYLNADCGKNAIYKRTPLNYFALNDTHHKARFAYLITKASLQPKTSPSTVQDKNGVSHQTPKTSSCTSKTGQSNRSILTVVANTCNPCRKAQPLLTHPLPRTPRDPLTNKTPGNTVWVIHMFPQPTTKLKFLLFRVTSYDRLCHESKKVVHVPERSSPTFAFT